MTSTLVRASFHDPDGSVFLTRDSVLRALSAAAGRRLGTFLEVPICQKLQAEGRLPRTRRLARDELGDSVDRAVPDATWLAHERVPFINYPHEWLPQQLAEAGLSVLELAAELRSAGWDIKDGNIRNVVFDGLRPVFVDFGSLVERDDNDVVWRPAGQLQRHVLLPLLLWQYRSALPSATLLARPDGIQHAEAYAALVGKRYTSANVFWLCTLPSLLGSFRRASFASSGRGQFPPEVAKAAGDRTVRALMRRLKSIKLCSRRRDSHWASYQQCREHYTSEQLALKRAVIERMLRYSAPLTVLDIGTNGGEYSNLAATMGHTVVSIDSDAEALASARSAARAAKLNVLHLLVDFANPTPALGWNGAECLSFDQRCAGAFDVVIALAVMHHILVQGGIPLQEFVAKLAAYSRRELVIEYVDPTDKKFSEIALQRSRDFGRLNRAVFEESLAAHFEVSDRVEIIPGHRSMYRCRRKPG